MAKINKLVNFSGRNYYMTITSNSNNITHDFTNQINNYYGITIIKHEHITYINNYDTGINYYNKKPHNKANCYNFYSDIYNEII